MTVKFRDLFDKEFEAMSNSSFTTDLICEEIRLNMENFFKEELIFDLNTQMYNFFNNETICLWFCSGGSIWLSNEPLYRYC